MFASRPGLSGGIRLSGEALPRPPLAIRQMSYAPLLSLPLGRPGGARLLPVVREGAELRRGDLLARAADGCAPALHAPATGSVLRIGEQADANGGRVAVIQFAPFPGGTQEYPAAPGLDVEASEAAQIVAAIGAAGICGSATEELHAHLWQALERPASMLLLNGIEADPPSRRQAAVLHSQAVELRLGLRFLLKALGARRALLAVEEGDAAAAVLLSAEGESLPLSVHSLPPRYPQGHPSLLPRALAASFPDVASLAELAGAPCLELATVAEIGLLLASGRKLTDQVVALAGPALREPGHYRVPLGTPLRFALTEAGLDADVAGVVHGGLMRGEALATLDTPIAPGMTAFVALRAGDLPAQPPPLPCIRCGDCIEACPAQLHPAQLGLLAGKAEWRAMQEQFHLDRCIECGCCAHVCPSRIPLVQAFRVAKAALGRLPARSLEPLA